jgi:hypothetical protein
MVIQDDEVVLEAVLDLRVFRVGLHEDRELSLLVHCFLGHEFDAGILLEPSEEDDGTGFEHAALDLLIGKELDDFELVDDIVEEYLNDIESAVPEDSLLALLFNKYLRGHRDVPEELIEQVVVDDPRLFDLGSEGIDVHLEEFAALLIDFAGLPGHSVDEGVHLPCQLVVAEVVREGIGLRAEAAEIFEEPASN